MPVTQTSQPPQKDIIPVNGWLMEIDGDELSSPHFNKISGLNKKTGIIEVVDGGSNRKLYFTDGLIEFGNLTITRARDGSADDKAFSEFFGKAFANGSKRNGELIQFRMGKEVFKLAFTGMLFLDYSISDFDTAGNDKSEQSYTVTVDEWVEEHISG